MIKLIASDIDGTLVHDGTHELNPELCDVILQLKEKGIQFVAIDHPVCKLFIFCVHIRIIRSTDHHFQFGSLADLLDQLDHQSSVNGI